MAAAVHHNGLWNSQKTFYKTFSTSCLPRVYRINLVVVDLALFEFDLYVPPSRPAAQTIPPNLHLPKENRANNGSSEIQVDQTKVCDHHIQPLDLRRLQVDNGGQEHKLG